MKKAVSKIVLVLTTVFLIACITFINSTLFFAQKYNYFKKAGEHNRNYIQHTKILHTRR